MTMGRHVRLFRNGRNQALRIPAEFELPGKEATIRKEGDRLIVEPTKRETLLGLLAGWDALEDELPEIEDTAPEPIDRDRAVALLERALSRPVHDADAFDVEARLADLRGLSGGPD